MSSSGLVGPSGAGVHAAPASRFLSAARGTGAATVVLKAQRVTPSGFAPYGQVRRLLLALRGDTQRPGGVGDSREPGSRGLAGGQQTAPPRRWWTAASGPCLRLRTPGAGRSAVNRRPQWPPRSAPPQLITPAEDGKAFDADDAQLMLDRGTPRLYIMRLRGREPVFDRMAFHTQACGRAARPWAARARPVCCSCPMQTPERAAKPAG